MATPVLPEDSAARKRIPLFMGLMKYFPRALAYVAEISFEGNEKHNPGEPLHWSREKSNDHEDCAARHLLDVGTLDAKGKRHSGGLAWRALAILELELEAAEMEAADPTYCKRCVTLVLDEWEHCPNCGRELDPVGFPRG
jgi:hypothetical protein